MLQNLHTIPTRNMVDSTVIYLTKYMLTKNKNKTFELCILGAYIVYEDSNCRRLLRNIKGLDDTSIYSACQIVGYEVCGKYGVNGVKLFKPVEFISPSQQTISDIRCMVYSILSLINLNGGISNRRLKFPFNYPTFITKNSIITIIMTEDESLAQEIYNQHVTALRNYKLTRHIKNIKYIIIFNPRSNIIYKYDI